MSGKPRTHDEQVSYEYGDELIHVDAGLAPLLERLWDRGIETAGSCEDRSVCGVAPPGTAGIAFKHIGEGGSGS